MIQNLGESCVFRWKISGKTLVFGWSEKVAERGVKATEWSRIVPTENRWRYANPRVGYGQQITITHLNLGDWKVYETPKTTTTTTITTTTTTTTPTLTPESPKEFNCLINPATNKYIGWSGDSVILWDCGAEDRIWAYEFATGYLRNKNVNGNGIIVWDCNQSSAQVWNSAPLAYQEITVPYLRQYMGVDANNKAFITGCSKNLGD